ncbi:putative C6 transcription factor [Talaromyces proteolyticus]|uniref:C6 transcription factor n=1 Tax=Talaromyces proteolyticus TaxID=1131652 RepID=A0AAD4L230_9EURO|nr:putative C6 transcription factor [Talaromyces proteolyticus]KAH8705734.1 putative C6 transcription factor [Talaromyces proteolyticus]
MATESNQLENGKDKIPACQSCRRKKAKCDREQPCTQCVRFNVDCLYDDGRLKPGLRAGAVEQLQHRVETLENMFIGQGLLWQKIWNSINPSSRECCANPSSFDQYRQQVKDSFLQMTPGDEESPLEENNGEQDGEESCQQDAYPVKRRKTISQSKSTELATPSAHTLSDHDLPSREIMNELVEFYFANVHHWIPILHVKKFRLQIQTSEGWESATQILHAIVATCICLVKCVDVGSYETRVQMAAVSRQKVILSSMESFSVENLQALVIIAFNTIGSGRGPSAWSIVGSMTRTVEQLQLSVEEPEEDRSTKKGEYLIRRMVFLQPTKTWWQAEERRRLFWAVFLMDRFCSVSTGWNLSLTSADVRRRLPCEGALWEKEHEVLAPFFGITDKSCFPGSIPTLVDNQLKDNLEQDAVGGFAYCIEATESLTLVINFFVHHALDLKDAQNAQVWLMRFKELDLRLVQWKLFLPPKWRTASVLNDDGVVDPNLTLAHITHNTAVILLHQSIAYPPPHWKNSPVRLPSNVSVDTCIEAATEIAATGHHFLHHSPILTNPQFSFCLFIAGRMLLAHCRYTSVPIPDQLDTIVSNLSEISRRWAGPNSPDRENLASVFAKRLANARKHIHSTASARGSLDIRQAVYSDSQSRVNPGPSGEHNSTPETRAAIDGPQAILSQQDNAVSPNILYQIQHDDGHGGSTYSCLSPTGSFSNSLSLAYPPLPVSLQLQYAPLTESNILDPVLLEKSHERTFYGTGSVETLPASQFWYSGSQ